MKRLPFTLPLALVVATVFASMFLVDVTATAYAKHEPECTQETLEGSYGYVLIGPLVSDGLVAAVGLTAFDGKGGLTAQDTVSMNGVISRRTGKGSYTVNPNCTGSATVDGGFAGFAFNFMIVPGTSGNEFSFIVANRGTVQTGVAMKTGDEGCTLASLQGTYRVLNPGGTNASGLNANVGFRILDGAGHLTIAEDWASVNGVITYRIGRSAVYTVNRNCTVQETFADGATFDGVIVAGGDEAYFLNTLPGRTVTALYKKQSRDHKDDQDN